MVVVYSPVSNGCLCTSCCFVLDRILPSLAWGDSRQVWHDKITLAVSEHSFLETAHHNSLALRAVYVAVLALFVLHLRY